RLALGAAMRNARLLLALSAVVATAACSSAPPDVSTTSAGAISGGQLDPNHPNVGLVFWTDSAGHSELCTGTLLTPRVVLTAAHRFFSRPANTPVTFYPGEGLLPGVVGDPLHPYDPSKDSTLTPHPIASDADIRPAPGYVEKGACPNVNDAA